jgi:hypothetical protein
MQAYIEFLKNVEVNMGKQKQVKEFRVIERFEDQMPKIWYSRSKLPMMSQREVLTETTIKDVSPHEKIVISKSIERDDVPVYPGAIRMTMFKASSLKEENGDIVITDFTNFNLKGMVPARLMNMVISASVGE